MQQSLAKTRRNVIIGACVVWGLVVVGIALASYQTVELERERILTAQRASHDDTVALAMYRLDAIEADIRKHRDYDFDVFKPEYQPREAYDRNTGAALDVDKLPILPSPLAEGNFPDWVLFHFQVGPNHWVSPQLGTEEEFSRPMLVQSSDARAELITKANWFDALRHFYEAEDLRTIALESKVAADTRAGISGAESTLNRQPAQSLTPLPRTDMESQRRRQELQMAAGPQLQRCECRPNILAETAYRGRNAHRERGAECLEYAGTEMLPTWLKLSLDGREQLALLRYVYADTEDDNDLWAVQGVLFDWPRLKATMESEIGDLLPGARIEPMPLDAMHTSVSLNSIPAHLVGTEMQAGNITGMALRRLGWGLSLIWLITIAAVTATIYGAIRYFRTIERRMRFTSAVTHELRTPLTSFQIYSDLLGDLRDDEGDQRRKYVSILQQESRRLSKLVENVFAYSRVAESGAKLAVKPIDTQTILDDLSRDTEQCRNNGTQRSLVVDNKVGAAKTIETDPGYVSQILINLVENACKYGGSNQIFVTARPTANDGVAVEIDDGGPGIDPTELNSIFDPFRRGKDAKTQATGGMGLGLALSRFWADCLQGKLSVERSPRNGGHYSCFVLELPNRVQSS